MPTIQLRPLRSGTAACLRLVAVIAMMYVLHAGNVAMASGSVDVSKATTAIAERYAALRKGDIKAFGAAHKDTRWIKESEFRAQHEKFSRYVIRRQTRLQESEKPAVPEVYFAVDEYYKGQSNPTRMNFVVRLEGNRWVITEFNADEPRSPTERSVEEDAKRMLNKK